MVTPAMPDLPPNLRPQDEHFDASLAAYVQAYRENVDEWLLACLREVDPRLWSTYVLQYLPSYNLRLLHPDGYVCGTFDLVRDSTKNALCFRGRVFAPPGNPKRNPDV